jgi:cyclophilin family peptidyl-prolyl cis-trans isomerase
MKKKFKMNNKIFIIVGIIALLLILNFTIDWKKTGQVTQEEMTRVKLTTNYGEIVINLYSDMPITTGNFVNLVESGVYDNTISHRIIDGFMIQAGDPTGTGYGDPIIKNIPDEFTHASGNKNNRGTISMANAGPNTGSSQFL